MSFRPWFPDEMQVKSQIVCRCCVASIILWLMTFLCILATDWLHICSVIPTKIILYQLVHMYRPPYPFVTTAMDSGSLNPPIQLPLSTICIAFEQLGQSVQRWRGEGAEVLSCIILKMRCKNHYHKEMTLIPCRCHSPNVISLRALNILCQPFFPSFLGWQSKEDSGV